MVGRADGWMDGWMGKKMGRRMDGWRESEIEMDR